MKMTIQQFRKHSLSLALLAGLGLSSSALLAQESTAQQMGSAPPAMAPDTRAAAEANARASAQYARRLEMLAREAAREAQEAARIAANFRDQGAATQHGADTAKATTHNAQQAAMAAQRARNEAIESSRQAQTGRTVAADGVNPTEGAVDAQVGARRTEQATREALDAAARANAAAAGTAIAIMPPVSETDETAQQGARGAQEQQRMAGQQQGAQTQQEIDEEYITGQAVVEGEGDRDVIVRSRPGRLPEDEDTGVTGDYDVSGDMSMNFSDLDENGDGFVSREEAQAHTNLSDEFNSVDMNNDGRLSREELQEWNR